MKHPLLRAMPTQIGSLGDLALDLRWTWSHGSDALWAQLDADLWERTRNPWLILLNISSRRLETLAQDPIFLAEYERAVQSREAYARDPTWWGEKSSPDAPFTVAYFSMEYAIGEALPIYSGGLGVLAGDHLKTASDLGVPLVAIGLLYQQATSARCSMRTAANSSCIRPTCPTTCRSRPCSGPMARGSP